MNKMDISTVLVEFNSNIANSIADIGWEIADPAQVSAWTNANRIASKRSFKTEDGRLYKLTTDLSPVVDRLKTHYEIMTRIFYTDNVEERARAAESFPVEKIPITFQIEHPPGRPGVSSIIEYYLSDLFLLLNISTPASFSLSRQKLSLVDTPNILFNCRIIISTYRGYIVSKENGPQ
ncbi:Hypothetical protein NGAL_HAMBI2605_07000 [Neorhizobium galegae bv. orientalis]|nr:Hypothetical protein NGAL_HAMBI2605_07000 [Neorhizobium galegae bv. orientalis]